MVIDGRLRNTQPFREVSHAGAVVAAFVEDLDGHREHGLKVMTRAAAARRIHRAVLTGY
jgi:hypothetical protein